jgi:hypothetical protein
VYVASEMATVLRFSRPVDPARTKMLGWEGRFEPLLAGGGFVVLTPLQSIMEEDRFLLVVTLQDGREVPFTITAMEGRFDHQVNVFLDGETPEALRKRLEDAHVREKTLKDENERLRKQEASIDHGLAALLVNGGRKQTSFVRSRKYVAFDDDAQLVVEILSGIKKAAVVFHVKNLSLDRPWRVREVIVSATRPGEEPGVVWKEQVKPFALKTDRDEIPPGQTGSIAVVLDKSAFLSAKGSEHLTLELFRHDGQLNAVLVLDPSLAREK